MPKGKRMHNFGVLLVIALAGVNLLHLLWTVWLVWEQIETGWGYGTNLEMLALLPWMTELLCAPVLLAGLVYLVLSVRRSPGKRLVVANAVLLGCAFAQIGITNLFLWN